MKCFVPVCENSSTISQGITFHRFPTDDRTRATWLQALGKQGSCLASGEVVCSQHFLTEDFIETRSGLKKLRRGASPFVINKLGLLNVNQKSKEVNQQAEMDGVYKVTTNVEMKNEKPDDSLLSVDIGVLVKQEPLDQALMDTYDNIYDSQFDVVKEEVTSNSSGMEIIYNSEYDVNSDVPYNLSFKEEITELVEESESPEHSSFSDLSARHSYMMTYVKVEHLDSFTSLPADCALAHDTPSRSTEDTSLNEASALKENILNGQKKRKLKKVKNGVQSENGFLVTPNKNIELSYCKLCSYKSISKANLERHMNKHSSKTMSLTCEICEYKFTTRGNLHRHMRNHSGEKPFSCNICGYKFFWKFRLDFHMKSHTGEKGFSCYICQNKFTTKSNLMVHVKKHTGEKPFSCDICDKKYLTKGSIVVHMRNHTGEKPFSCGICKNRFTTKNSLMYHMSSHSGDRPYSCIHCEKNYITKGTLTAHMRNHTRQKAFSCDLCNYKSVFKSYLVTHMKSHSDSDFM